MSHINNRCCCFGWIGILLDGARSRITHEEKNTKHFMVCFWYFFSPLFFRCFRWSEWERNVYIVINNGHSVLFCFFIRLSTDQTESTDRPTDRSSFIHSTGNYVFFVFEEFFFKETKKFSSVLNKNISYRSKKNKRFSVFVFCFCLLKWWIWFENRFRH